MPIALGWRHFAAAPSTMPATRLLVACSHALSAQPGWWLVLRGARYLAHGLAPAGLRAGRTGCRGCRARRQVDSSADALDDCRMLERRIELDQDASGEATCRHLSYALNAAERQLQRGRAGTIPQEAAHLDPETPRDTVMDDAETLDTRAVPGRRAIVPRGTWCRGVEFHRIGVGQAWSGVCAREAVAG